MQTETRVRWWLPYAIGITVPLLFFMLLELTLILAGYGSDLSLFKNHHAYPEYRQINPDVGQRYYISGKFKPETDYLVSLGLTPDIYFAPVSGCNFRDKVSLKQGVYYTINKMSPKTVLPMHGGTDGSKYIDFIKTAEKDGIKAPFHFALSEGDWFFYKDGKMKDLTCPNRANDHFGSDTRQIGQHSLVSRQRGSEAELRPGSGRATNSFDEEYAVARNDELDKVVRLRDVEEGNEITTRGAIARR